MELLASLVQMGGKTTSHTGSLRIIPVGQRLPEAQRGLKEARQGARGQEQKGGCGCTERHDSQSGHHKALVE